MGAISAMVLFASMVLALISVHAAVEGQARVLSDGGFSSDPLTSHAHPQQMKAIQFTQPLASPAQSKPAHVNRLIHENSPYLLQHAHNPVDWWAWGDEAFQVARQQDKPIFLSIGYSTCYWCHVMERECFENEDIAALMNANYICIKVDREERPDVDDLYMAATQLLTQSGGWPMSVFLEPHTLKPFMAGTYFPPEDLYGRPGFPSVLRQMSEVWNNQREAVIQQANAVAVAVKEHLSESQQPVALGQKHVDQAIAALMSAYDRQDGGFGAPGAGRGPKFPTPVNLDLLMGAAWDNDSAGKAVLHTLERMATGGMYDQVGGGFHRYSVDAKWLVPHYEKMLYDNGQLVSTYARALELTNDPYYAEIVRETLEYVLREMTSREGGFFSAQDAEVHSREGDNYLWTSDEVRDVLAAAGLRDDVEFTLKVYGLDRGTNFQDPHHPELPPRNVLHLCAKPADLASRMTMPVEQFNARIERINATLLEARTKRDQPRLDDKILAGWNGLMIAGFADGGRVLKEPRFVDAAKRAASFVLENMRTGNGGLQRSHRNGQSKIDAFLEDYALMIRGLIALHRATKEHQWPEAAEQLAAVTRTRFWDSTSGGGGYFDTLDGQSDLFVRIKSSYDGAVPSGNSVMLINLLDLHELTWKPQYLDDALATLRSLSSMISQRPTGSVVAVLGLKRIIDQYPQKLEAMAKNVAATASAEVVDFSVECPEVRFDASKFATLNLTMHIAKGYHINSHDPGADFLIPLTIDLVDGDGVRLIVDYPPGEEFRGAFAEVPIRVHSGAVTIPLRFEKTGKITGHSRIVVTFQACTDKACQQPRTVALEVRIRGFSIDD